MQVLSTKLFEVHLKVDSWEDFFFFSPSYCLISSDPFEVTENVNNDFSEGGIGLYGALLKGSCLLSLRRSSKSIDLLLLGTSEDFK